MKRFKKKLILITWIRLMLLSCVIDAQELPDRFFAGFSLGPSFPVGKYYMNDPEEGSYANPGAVLSAQAGWYFSKYLGAGLHFGEQQHPVDEHGMVTDKLVADPFLEKLSLQSDPFEVRTYSAGILLRSTVSGKVSFQGKVMGGMMWARTPDQLYGASYFGGINYSYWITSAKDWTPSLLLGAALQYDVCDYIRIGLESDFVLGNPEFTFYTTTSSYQVQHPIRFINACLGFNYVF